MRGEAEAGSATSECPRVERLHQIPAHWARHRGAAVALRDARCSATWADLEAMRTTLAAELQAAGVRPGDRVMLVGENCAAMVAAIFAASTLGAWLVNVNARLSAREIGAIRAHCAPRTCLYFTGASADAAAHAGERPATRQSASLVAWDEVRLEEAAAGAQAEDDTGIAALVYTTGTTGDPKGVMLRHEGILFVAERAMRLRRLTPQDRVAGVLPLSHVYGLSSMCMGSLLAGGCLHLHARFVPAALERAFAEEGITICQGVPAMYAKYLEHLARAGRPHRAPALRGIYCGGSPLSPAVKREVEAAFGLVMHNGYGLTEASPTVTQTRIESPRTDCSVGPALPGLEVRIVDGSGRPLADGEIGELWVRGPTVMKGYYHDEDATAQALRPGGWLATGDLARRDPDGALHIEGRLKELIIRSGFNVYPVEVEAVLNAHPLVTQSAVVGREVEGNEEVVAFVELVPDARVSAQELLEFAAHALAPYKRPTEVVILPQLPAAASGKVLKGKLKALARAPRAS